MVPLILAAASVVGLLMYLGISKWVEKRKSKSNDENILIKVLNELRSKKKAMEKIDMIEFLNCSPKFVSNILNNMKEKDLINVNTDGITITEFGKHYYDKFLKRK